VAVFFPSIGAGIFSGEYGLFGLRSRLILGPGTRHGQQQEERHKQDHDRCMKFVLFHFSLLMFTFMAEFHEKGNRGLKP
jgi:hypothetical protein